MQIRRLESNVRVQFYLYFKENSQIFLNDIMMVKQRHRFSLLHVSTISLISQIMFFLNETSINVYLSKGGGDFCRNCFKNQNINLKRHTVELWKTVRLKLKILTFSHVDVFKVSLTIPQLSGSHCNLLQKRRPSK